MSHTFRYTTLIAQWLDKMWTLLRGFLGRTSSFGA